MSIRDPSWHYSQLFDHYIHVNLKVVYFMEINYEKMKMSYRQKN